MKISAKTSAWILFLVCFSFFAHAEVRPDKVRTADAKKTGAYIRDGLVVGGDKAVNEVIVKDVRRAANPAGFDRLVVDLQGNRNGEPVAIARPPFFQVSINSDERRVAVTVFGKFKLALDAKKVLAAFKKSPVVENVAFYPLIEDDSWTFVFEMKEAYLIEVFELTNPVRIILDVKTQKPAAQTVKEQKKASALSAIESEGE